MIRYYGNNETPFVCEELVERHERILGKQTRNYQNFDELYQSFREERYDLLEKLVEDEELMVTDINIWVCEIHLNEKYVTRRVQQLFDTVYKKSYKREFMIHEAVVFYYNPHHVYSIYKEVDNTHFLTLFMTVFIQRMCALYPSHINKLHICGGIAPVHATLQLAGYIKSTVLDALLMCKANINIGDMHGATPLHHAAWGGVEDNVEMLLERGADKNIRDADGKTPFDVAVEQGNMAMAKRLRVGTEQFEDTSQRWSRYGKIRCPGGALEFSNHVTNIPQEEDITEFIHSAIASKGVSGNASTPVAGDAEELRIEVSVLMTRVAEIVEDCDSRFAFEPLLTGSVEQGGKVGPPDEFDYNCILTKFSELCKDVAEERHPGYVKLVQVKDPPADFAEYFDNGYLNYKMVNATLYGLIEKALSVIHLQGYKSDKSTLLIVNPPYRQVLISAVAYKMFLLCNSKQLKYLKFKVDLAAALCFKPYTFKLEPFLGIEKCMYVHIDDNNIASVNCRISMTLQENTIFRTFTDEMIKSYGLLKLLLILLPSHDMLPAESEFFAPDANTKGIDKLGLDLICSTYHFKQSLIKAVLENHRRVPIEFTGREIEFWAKESLDRLITSYRTRQMATPWLPAHNVLLDHTKRRSPHVQVPPDGIARCYEYLLAHANILRCILHQENTVDHVPSSSDEEEEPRTSAFNELSSWFQ